MAISRFILTSLWIVAGGVVGLERKSTQTINAPPPDPSNVLQRLVQASEDFGRKATHHFAPGSDTSAKRRPDSSSRRLGGPKLDTHGDLNELWSAQESIRMGTPVYPSAAAAAAPQPVQEDGFLGTTSYYRQCDRCGSNGSCSRTEPIGDRYSVEVEGSPDSLWLATCVANGEDLASFGCVFAPNNEKPDYVSGTADLFEHVNQCLEEQQCCNVIYSREHPQSIALVSTECDTATCRWIERFCRGEKVTVECPVGSIMLLTSLSDFSAVSSSGSIIAAVIPARSTSTCSVGSMETASCLGGGLMVVSADDCNCVRCDYNAAGESQLYFPGCTAEVTTDWYAEGSCKPDEGTFCSRDNTAPEVEIISPSEGRVYDDTEDIFVFAIANDDEEGGQDKITWYLNGIRQLVPSLNAFFPNGALPIGEHVLEAQAIDSRGVASSLKSVSFSVAQADPNAPAVHPTVVIATSSGAEHYYLKELEVEAHVKDASGKLLTDEELNTIVWYVDGVGQDISTTTFKIPPEGLACGNRTISVFVEDLSENTAATGSSVLVRPDPDFRPQLSVLTPTRLFLEKGGPNVEIEVDTIYADGRPINWSWYLDKRAQEANCGAVELDTSSLSVGRHVVTVQTVDPDYRGQASDLYEIEVVVREATVLEPCANDDNWIITRSNGQRTCGWVRRNTALRCGRRGDDGRPAYVGCPFSCGDDPKWQAEIGPRSGGDKIRTVDCDWVRNKPFNRCRAIGKDDTTRAWEACAATCCKFNAQRYGTVAEELEVVSTAAEANDFDDEVFPGGVERRHRNRCCNEIASDAPE